uniref:Uncharacterized protein n=1 Tax=Solanum tuberosum TaxID=4113 RepID=M1DBX4_SOLTU
MKPNVGMTTTRVKDLTRMNPLEFHGSKVEEHHQKFIDEEKNQGKYITGQKGAKKTEEVEGKTYLAMEMDSRRTVKWIRDLDPDRLKSQNPEVKERRKIGDEMEPLEHRRLGRRCSINLA